jgi:hypothetical protein
MADPPITTTEINQKVVEDEVEEKTGQVNEDGQLVLVKEGYFRYIDILFEWCKYMNPWQVSNQLFETRNH